MLFNSIEFAIFLPIVFILFWLIPQQKIKLQNALILVVSYIFYGWWDYRFLSLIAFSSIVDYITGLKIYASDTKSKKRIYLMISLAVNLGLLGFFKYFNFFIDNFATAFSFFGYSIQANRLNVVLPVGISFYTFQTMSYSLDIYREKLKPTKDFIAFFAFVSFFPQLVAGPIERASNLLPQFFKKRKFEYHKATDGLRQILWGLFKKIVIADNCATLVNGIFADYSHYSPLILILGAIFFTLQIYGDFSGYSDIAIGTAKLFGFNLMQNFAFPYFSRDIAEFWRKWHISLSTWFRDYVYIPLGGSKGSWVLKTRNIFIIFLVSGFWHGANWTFIVWGALNALYFIPLMLLNKNRKNLDSAANNKLLPSTTEFFQITITFTMTSFAFIIFRAKTIGLAVDYIKHMLFNYGNTINKLPQHDVPTSVFSFIIILFILTEWIQRTKMHALQLDKPTGKLWRYAIYFAIFFMILTYGAFNKTEFIYFAF